jgi:glycosyltransferase involved in cell wall biosynthesis
MPKLISANFVKDEEHCIKTMLDTVQPYVDESYVLIDDKTKDKTEEIARSLGCKIKYYKFENFGKTWNTLLHWIKEKSDWTILIAPDECITADFGEMLTPLLAEIHESKVDGVWFPRRHWEDLEMQKEYTKQNWYPDWQLRLLRNDFPRIHLIHYVHEWPMGLREQIRIEKDIHHFNMYWKPRMDYNFEKMNQLYSRLQQQQRMDGGGNIWPDEM